MTWRIISISHYSAAHSINIVISHLRTRKHIESTLSNVTVFFTQLSAPSTSYRLLSMGRQRSGVLVLRFNRSLLLIFSNAFQYSYSVLDSNSYEIAGLLWYSNSFCAFEHTILTNNRSARSCHITHTSLRTH